MRKARPSSFIKQPHLLQLGKKGEALLVYRAPNAHSKRYEMAMISPVQIYPAPGSKLARLKTKDQQALANYFHASLRRELGQILSHKVRLANLWR